MNKSLKLRIIGAIIIALTAIFIFAQTNKQLSSLISSNFEKIITQINKQEQSLVTPSTDKQLKNWVIQVGSFRSEKHAHNFKNTLRELQFTAYVTPAKVNNNTLFHVSVGPELNRDIALKTQQNLEEMLGSKTLLIHE
jgi:cell division septation protein DedD